jgi:hypothetical protein
MGCSQRHLPSSEGHLIRRFSRPSAAAHRWIRGYAQPHIASPLAVRLTAAVIVTAFAAVAKIAAGPRAAAATAVVGVLIGVVLLHQLA